jgi:hypothetical protein
MPEIVINQAYQNFRRRAGQILQVDLPTIALMSRSDLIRCRDVTFEVEKDELRGDT